MAKKSKESALDLECAKCGAPLDAARENQVEHFIVCAFCQTQNYVPGFAPRRDPTREMPAVTAMPRGEREAFEREMARRNAAELDRVRNDGSRPDVESPQAETPLRPRHTAQLLGFVLAMLGFGAVVAYKQHSTEAAEQAEALAQVNRAVREAGATIARALGGAGANGHADSAHPFMPAGIGAADFATLPKGAEQLVSMDLLPIDPGGRLQADALIEYVRTLAQAWRPSAVLVDVRIEELTLDGSFDTTRESQTFRAWFRDGTTRTSPLLGFELRNGQLHATSEPSDINEGTRRLTQPLDFGACTLTRALVAGHRRSPEAKEVSFFAYLRGRGREPTVWFLSPNGDPRGNVRVRVDRCVPQ